MSNRFSALQFFSPKEVQRNKKKAEAHSPSPVAKRRKTMGGLPERTSPPAPPPTPKDNPDSNLATSQSKKKRKRNKKNKKNKAAQLDVSEAPTVDLDQLVQDEDISDGEEDTTWHDDKVQNNGSPVDESDEDASTPSEDEDDLNSHIPIQPMEAAKSLASQIMGKDLTSFFRDVFGQKSIFLSGSLERPLHLWYSSEDIFDTLKNERLIVGEDLHLTKYENGEKVSLEEGSVAYPCLLRDMMMEEGCTIRLVQPHRYHRTLSNRLSLLQEIFGSAMGCNVYFTPEQSQGFAPHYDDIDAFVLQLEGSKHWRVYKPRNQSEAFDLKSSGDFTMEEIAHCECVFDATLHPGDVLYMPRSFVHHAFSNGDEPSLHLTISTYHNTSYFNLIDKLLPLTLPRFLASNVQVRKNLPLGYLNYTGTFSQSMSRNPNLPHNLNRVASGDNESTSSRRGKSAESVKSGNGSAVTTSAQAQRAALEAKVREFLHKLADWKHLPIDEACDLLGLDMVRYSIPPMLFPGEERNHVAQASFEPTLNSLVRLTRWSTLRLVTNKQVGIVMSPEDQAELERENAVESIVTSVPEKPSSSKKRQRVSSISSEKDELSAANSDGPVFECLYHNLMNKFEHAGSGDLGNYHLLTKRLATAIKLLLTNYPQYTQVADFPLPDADHKMDAALALYRMGLLIVAPGDEDDLSYMFGSTEEDEHIGCDCHGTSESGSEDVPSLAPISEK